MPYICNVGGVWLHILVGVSELLKFVVLLGLVLVGVSCSSLWCCWELVLVGVSELL